MPPDKRLHRIACILRAAKSAGRTCRIAGKTINSCVFLPLCRCVSSVGTSACEENGQDFGENRVREPEGRKLLVLYTRFGGRIASDGGLGGRRGMQPAGPARSEESSRFTKVGVWAIR